jgi:hypothetical protein
VSLYLERCSIAVPYQGNLSVSINECFYPHLYYASGQVVVDIVGSRRSMEVGNAYFLEGTTGDIMTYKARDGGVLMFLTRMKSYVLSNGNCRNQYIEKLSISR